ncbi:hypothetical protein D049_0283B, partial [Vibrio parahaemolyticus VPTS-2010]
DTSFAIDELDFSHSWSIDQNPACR